MNQPPTSPSRAPAPHELRWFGHPRGLSTLFFTELWERFSYYGMRAILFLFMTKTVLEGGLQYSEGTAAAVYGIYVGMVYLLALPGGWVADNLWGQRKAVFVGGCIIAAGHFSMAVPVLNEGIRIGGYDVLKLGLGVPDLPFFFGGLILIVIGTGLLKPNVSTIVGELYPEGGVRRDAGFSVYYMGINLGAFSGPLICGVLGEKVDWHIGFSAAGFGMILGLIQYKLGGKYLGEAGEFRGDPGSAAVRAKGRNFYAALGASVAVIGVFSWLVASGVIAATLSEIATWLGYLILLLVVGFFTYLVFDLAWTAGITAFFAAAVAALMAAGYDHLEAGRYAVAATVFLFIVVNLVNLMVRGAAVSVDKRRLLVIFWLFLLAALFWSGFEQAGSSMTRFAESYTDRFLGPHEWLGTAGTLALTALVAGLFAWGFSKVARRSDLFTLEKVLVAAVGLGLTVFAWWIFKHVVAGWEMPTSWLQSVPPLFVITLAPVFAVLWTWLASVRANPSIPVKFALGLIGVSAGFFVLVWGAANAGAGGASPAWLVVTYFLHTCGELCLSPVGLSSMTKLAPQGKVGQMMGVWFIGSALGNLIAGLVAGLLENQQPQQLFLSVASFIGAAGLLALLLAPLVRKLMGDVK